MESNRGDERCSRHTQRAHHMRRGQQPGMHRTPHTTHDTHSNPRQHTNTALPQHQHTHGRGRSKQERHTRLHRMHIPRERSVVSAPRTEGAHTQEGAAHTATQRQSNNEKSNDPRTPRGLLVHGKCSQYSSQSSLLSCFGCMLLQRVSSARAVRTKVASIPSCGLGQSQTVEVQIPNDEGIPAVDGAESPVVRRGSAARGVRDEAVAEEPGPSPVPAFVLPACLACWHAWQLRWRPAREAPVKKTVAPLWHPHGRP
ncbi:hypothetical protein TCSYLVIO_009598, partial [Trypanosoma cruzi]